MLSSAASGVIGSSSPTAAQQLPHDLNVVLVVAHPALKMPDLQK
jgi:hypothetical protein